MLLARNVHAGYGSVMVLRDVTIGVEEGEVVALLGANGAGKSTTLRCLAGMHRPADGSIWLDGRRMRPRSAADLARAGIGFVPEGRGIARTLTVAENLRLGGYRWRRDRARAKWQTELVLSMFPALEDALARRAGMLSGGQQQMLAIARALMGHPRVLLVDEASLGLAPVVVDALYRSLAALNATGLALLVVEQNPARILPIAQRAYVLERGVVALEGSADEVARSDLLRLYLGEAPVVSASAEEDARPARAPKRSVKIGTVAGARKKPAARQRAGTDAVGRKTETEGTARGRGARAAKPEA